MPRKPVPIVPNQPYHISARCHNREWFDLPLETVWSIMEDYLFMLSEHFGVEIYSFVLMSNHFHLLINSSSGKVSEGLLHFMRETSREITRLSGRINQTYGRRNHKTYIGNYHYFMNSYKYVYQNPLRAGICKWVEDYPYSTLHGLFGFKKLIIPVRDSLLFSPEYDESVLQWLNKSVQPEYNDEMRKALRKKEFSLGKKDKKPSLLETQLL